MIPPSIRAVELGGSPELPALVVGPSLGTSVSALWASAAAQLAGTFHTIGWDLPGHGGSDAPVQPFTIADLAHSLIELIGNAHIATPMTYAGVSVGGAVGLQLLLDRPDYFTTAALICTGAKFGDGHDWRARAQQVCAHGTPIMVSAAAQRWFTSGFQKRNPDAANTLLDSLRQTDKAGYAHTCRALGQFDLRDRLREITTPVLAIAGASDIVTRPELLRTISTRVADGRYVELSETAHLAPAEQPHQIAKLITAHAGRNRRR